ncbi:SCO family protein [Rufibacter sp. DG15C]|uniref:SCO family protein n=1 Tax=Rufibacter sp. DG15C TaxID=1379909 RepID=UPI0018D36DB9|nr:SCO family protein [Rufibacter sp. DG15C]
MNTFSLRTYFPAKVTTTAANGVVQSDTTFFQVPEFQLTSQTGATFSHKNLQGKVYVAHFFDASCQGSCKQVSTQLTRVHDAFYAYPEVMIVSFTLKPVQDQVNVLEQYAKSFRANPVHWVFLTGPQAQIDSIAYRGKPSSVANSHEINHDELWLVDKERHVRGVYNGSQADEIDRLITEINVLISEYKK